MSTFEEAKKNWKSCGLELRPSAISNDLMEQLVRKRMKTNLNSAMKYFWSSFVLQMIVYGLLCNVLIRYWGDASIVTASLLGIGLFIPFTIVLLKKYKALAVAKIDRGAGVPVLDSMADHIRRQRDQLQAFYTFKKRYELFLIPVSCIIGVFVSFELYLPGGAFDNFNAGLVVFVITLASCAISIRHENKAGFVKPLEDMNGLLKEFGVM